jgi:hypothetical protein
MRPFTRRLLRLLGRSVDLLTGLIEWFLRGRWLVIRMIGAMVHLLGIDGRVARASVAFRRLPALMRRSVGTRDHAQVAVLGRTPVVSLRGTPTEMGDQYGRLLRQPLRALETCIESAIPAGLQRRLLKLARRSEPHLPDSTREEICAIADAAGVRPDLLMAMNTTTRIACTTIAARDAGGHVVMGRNGDFFGMGLGERAMAVVVRRPSSGLPTVSVNFLGMVGAFTGMNARGVAFGNMVVLNAGGVRLRPAGLPIQIALRQAAEQATDAAQLADIMARQVHAAPMNVMAADTDGALVAELGLDGSAVRPMAEMPLIATNYFHTPELAGDHHRAARADACQRYQRLAVGRYAARNVMSVADLKHALHRTRVKMLNLQAVVFEPAAMRMHVSINRLPASAGPYTLLDVGRLLAD